MRILKFAAFVALAAVATALSGAAVFYLWNWLMPSIFGLHVVTFWQALGLLALCWILFRGFPGGRRWHPGGRMMRRRWAAMTPEQRQEFRNRMGARCTGMPSAPQTPQAS